LRSSQTDAEARLWSRLRNRQLNGYKFIRQAPIGNFFADFVCREPKVAVEVDGATHVSDAEIARDAERSAALRRLGYRVVRVTNADVSENLDGVLELILSVVERET
jgi:very-short-patch-repair endonuclease